MVANFNSQRCCSLRLMDKDDLPDVLRIERASYAFPWSEGIFRDCLKAGYHAVVVLEAQEIIGYGFLMVAAGEAHVLNICIRENARGNRFSRSLLEDFCAIADKAGVREIYLEVRPSNTVAIALYDSMGFNQIGTRPNYYDAAGGREDALVFVKSLSV